MSNEKATSTVLLNGEQPKKELSVLAQRAETLRQKLVEANKAGDGKAFNKLTKELNDTNKQMAQLSKEAFDVKKVLDNLSGSSLKDLTKAKKELDKQLRSDAIVRGSKEWDELQLKLKAVKSEMVAVNNESRVGATGMEKFSGGFRQMIMGAVAGIAALSGVYMQLKKFMELRMALQDSQANLKAITGLDDDDITWLTAQAKKLSTSTTEAGVRITASSKEIVDGYVVIGSKRPDLLKNKEALSLVTEQALTLAAAGKMEVVPAFEAVTASMNQFNLGADQSNRIINVLGAGALEGSAEISDLSDSMKNVGTVAANSNMSLEQTVAALEVLASKQLLSEEAGTKLRGALLKMKEAGVGYTSGIFNMRDAIIEINSKLEKKSTALQRDAYMQKVFGIENITAGMILLDNVDSYERLTKAITNTAVAETQAGINTSTTSAKLKQATNNYNEAGMMLVEKLEPALLSVTNAGVALIKIFVKYPALAISIVSALGLLTAAYIANTVASMAQVLWTKLVAEATALANSKTILFFKTLLLNPYVAIAAGITAFIVLIYSLIKANDEAAVAQRKFNENSKKSEENIASECVQIDTLFERLKSAKKGTEEYNAAKKAILDKYGQYLTGLGLEIESLNNVAGAYDAISTAAIKSARARALSEATASAADDLSKTQGDVKEKVKNLIDKQYGKGTTKAEAVYLQVVPIIESGKGSEALNRAFSEQFDVVRRKELGGVRIDKVLDNLIDKAKDAKKAFDGVNKSAELKFGEAKGNDEIVAAAKPNEGEEKTIDGVLCTYTNGKWVKKKIKYQPDPGEVKTVLQKKLDKIDTGTLSDQSDLKEKRIKNEDGLQLEEKYQLALQKIVINSLEKKKKLYKVGSKEWLELENQILDIQLKSQDDANKVSLNAMKELQDKRLDAIVLYDIKQREQIELDFENGTISQDEHDNKILALDKVLAESRLSAAKANAKEIAAFVYKSEAEKVVAVAASNKEIEAATKDLTDAEKKILVKSVADKKAIEKEISEIEKKYGVNAYKDKQKEYEKDLIDLKAAHQKELAEIKKNGGDKKAAENRYQTDVAKIKLQHAIKQAEDIAAVFTAAGNLSSSLQEGQMLAVENKYAAELKAAKGNAKETARIEEELAAEKLRIQKDNADTNFAISVLQISANTAVAVMKAIAELGPIAGPIAAALIGLTGISQIAVANKQREALQNLWTGGFTEPGDKYKPTGIVHAGEFVGNQDAVSNKPIRRIFNLVDYAQKTNTVARITDADIMRAVGLRGAFANGGFTSAFQAVGSKPDSDNNNRDLIIALYSALDKTTSVNKALLAEIQNGIKVPVSIAGTDGLAEKLDLYYKMVSNASR